MKPLNLFYEEPDPDRWFPGDRHPRRAIRNLVRRNPRISGQKRVFLNLKIGLDRLGIPYRENDYRYIRNHPDEVACIIGKPNVLETIPWQNPILFGASIFSHPCDEPPGFQDFPIRRILVPGDWVVEMWKPYYGDRVHPWPVGIDTDQWQPHPDQPKTIDFLLYDKVRWEHEHYTTELIDPIRAELNRRGLTFAELRYGQYEERDFHALLHQCKAMIFLCEHETQGIAYQQALACNVPILAWDRGGAWRDPNFYPQREQFAPVSSVPYWDRHCGLKFPAFGEFPQVLEDFQDKRQNGLFSPRDYILEHLTLERCAQQYLAHVEAVQGETAHG
ncbi:MAG: hypothetical protein MH252_19745 [Thermosynechococcaceae cyanobacterium MS004]|nr:hypothetical protein [Thermosynechococcaceae cyanobacterium MS004]